ncbi:cation diffusion facilitator family transporter [Sphingomonas crocodyli]|uniref:Cation diffusion facilitator family transporter n=1 Tax=Sphingomonas crocodyli TaxID=1979270 RepID=A0A437M8M9_9SPHN|nr:cation diffusion facilitator family transporter [Sphingomonas crocodyli]
MERRTALPVTLNVRAALASVSVALILAILKGHAAWISGSVAMLGSLADTVLDIVASLATLYGVRLAARPADRKHRFGHGKAEAIAALFQVVLISISAFGLIIRAIEQWIEGAETGAAHEGIAVSVLSLILTGGLLLYQRRIIAQTGSVAIRTDNVHYQSDLLLNGAVIVALVLDGFVGVTGADPLFGIAIALWLAWGAWRASGDAIDQLMDKEWPEEKRQAFVRAVRCHPELEGIHELRTRTSGDRDFVQFHIWVDPAMTIGEAHRAMDALEARLMAEFPDTEILINPEPTGQFDPKTEMTA